MIDRTGLILHANQAGMELLAPTGGTNRRSLEEFCCDIDECRSLLRDIVAGETIKTRELKLKGEGGKSRSVLIDSSAAIEKGIFKYGRIVIQDLSGLMIVDRAGQLHNEVLKILVESSTTREATARLVPTMAQALGCDVGLVWRADEKNNRLERLVLWRANPHAEADHFLLKSNNISLNVGNGFPAERWFSDRAQKITVEKDTHCCGSPMAQSLPDYRQIVSVPIAIGRRNWGLFGFFSRQEITADTAFITMLEQIGVQIGQFIEKQEAVKNYQKMQESYALAIAGADEGIWDWDFTTNEVFFSSRWKTMLGFEDHELEDHFDTFRSLAHPDDYPRVMDAVQRHMESRGTYEEEFRMRTKQGHYVWICARGHCSFNALGQAVRMSGSHRDITALKEAELARLRSEASLVEAESKFRTLAENIREVFWIMSADKSQFYYVSPAFEEFWGMSCKALYEDASIFFQAICGDDRERVMHALDTSNIDPQGLDLEFRLGRVQTRCAESAGGEPIAAGAEARQTRWMWAKVFPVSDKKEGVARLCGIAHDITSKKELERQVSEFYSTISHELRTPLTSVQAALGLVQSGLPADTSSETLEYTKVARANCDRLIRLVNDMLDLRRLEVNRLPLRLSRLRAELMTRAAVDSLKPYAGELNVALNDEVQMDLPDFIGDSDRVMQILTNLISNAIRFTPAGKSVQVGARKGNGGSLRFTVRDQGPGISMSEKPDLFGPFQQLTRLEDESNKGTGLGLAISKALVEKMDGTIGVNSTPGEGAEFWFEMPLYTGVDGKETCSSELPCVSAKGTASERQQPLIMVLEDSDSIALILKGLLLKKGYSVVRSATISEGRNLLKSIQPHMLIADLNLPDGNGLDFVNWMQQHGGDCASVPVLLLSGVEADLSNIKRQDLVDWLRKPFDSDKLLALIKERLAQTIKTV